MVLLVLGFKLFESRVVGSEVDLRLGFPFQTVLKCMVISRSSNKTCSDVFLFAVYFHCVSTPKASKQDDHDDHDDHATHEFFFCEGIYCQAGHLSCLENASDGNYRDQRGRIA